MHSSLSVQLTHYPLFPDWIDRVKKLLSREETLYPNIYDNIRRSLIPVMHDDMECILKCYTEEAVSKSRKIKGAGKKNKKRNHPESTEDKNDAKMTDVAPTSSKSTSSSNNANPLEHYSDDQLLKEIVRRKAQKFRLAGAMKRLDNESKNDEEPQNVVDSDPSA